MKEYELMEKGKMGEYKLLVGGEWRESDEKVDVVNPYDDSVVATVSFASKEDVGEAIESAVTAFQETKGLPSYVRSRILTQISRGLEERMDELARVISLESGKPIGAARGEVARAVSTFSIAAEEANRIGGEVLPLDITEAAEGRIGITRRFPIGPIAAISPFNFPLNLVAHKVAPAIASGCPVIVKPPSKTPITSLILGEIVMETELPKGALSVLPCSTDVAEPLTTDPRLKMLTFTGSGAVGWSLKKKADPRKKVILELGGNAGLIVHGDADVNLAVSKALIASFAYAGQVCISVQRLYVHEDIYKPFMEKFVDGVKGLKLGDPLDPNVDLGPMVDEKAAERTQGWVEEAVKDGASVLAGGKARGRYFEPTVLVNASPQSKVCSEEIFAPVVTVFKYGDIDEALDSINDSHYGLQAGIFTNDHDVIWHAFERLEVGGVMINDTPMFRVDNMPYGGIKDSGFGREGLKYAIEEMTELKLMVLNFSK
ncbi:MAG: aldehyde dehydrogenase family protein [Candidatus Hydrothermarchaeaceae archaeon]